MGGWGWWGLGLWGGVRLGDAQPAERPAVHLPWAFAISRLADGVCNAFSYRTEGGGISWGENFVGKFRFAVAGRWRKFPLARFRGVGSAVQCSAVQCSWGSGIHKRSEIPPPRIYPWRNNPCTKPPPPPVHGFLRVPPQVPCPRGTLSCGCSLSFVESDGVDRSPSAFFVDGDSKQLLNGGIFLVVVGVGVSVLEGHNSCVAAPAVRTPFGGTWVRLR